MCNYCKVLRIFYEILHHLFIIILVMMCVNFGLKNLKLKYIKISIAGNYNFLII